MPKLSSETFVFNSNDVDDILDKVQQRMIQHSQAFPNRDINITVTFSKNFMRKETFDYFSSLVTTNKSSWKKYSYTFDFGHKKYFWDGKEIHLTSSEELAFYRHLVLEIGIGTGIVRQALANARRRLGTDFLREAIP